MKKRLLLTMICLALMLGVCACGQGAPAGQEQQEQSAPTWQEQYDLGVRYLSEGNYEEAVIAFTAAIEIDPKHAPAYVGRGDTYIGSGKTEENLSAAQADYEKAIELDSTLPGSYIGLADVYIHQGHLEKALEILRTALEKVSDQDAIQNKIREIEPDTMTGFSSFFENPISWDEITIGGYPFNECTPELLAQVYDGFSSSNESGNMFSTYNGLKFTYVEESGYRQATYVASASLEFRGLFCGQDEITALQSLGFTEAGIAYAKSAERTSYSIGSGECISASAHTDNPSSMETGDFSIELGFMSENSGYVHIWFKEGKLDSLFIDSLAE